MICQLSMCATKNMSKTILWNNISVGDSLIKDANDDLVFCIRKSAATNKRYRISFSCPKSIREQIQLNKWK